MNWKALYRAVIILFILALNIGCDQVSKSIVRKKMSYDEPISFIQNHFTLIKIENTGAFLSVGDNLPNPYRFILLTLLPVLSLLAGTIFMLTQKNFSRLILAGLICIIGGGIGNIYDRIAHGSVTDFMHIRFGIFQTGIFNVADVSIMVGIGLILLDALVKQRAEKRLQAATPINTADE
ncbi:signal peptidase II [Mucilaginibacter pedocola]|uniref:Lipoprotein signal peptidase n=1 Tax=Mucilaginibacter pedocola TaxID=1792845 RepID=A0A1S9PB81_9SPHI|nr:signal peptidase II [Mucilaginibacter pedocola]OOQ58171.1 signal peptidase II [Mucilaginibacter pedocola]